MDEELDRRRREDSGLVKYRSWSQLEQYEACPHRYYLARIERVWKKPAAWLPMGTAVHYAAEMWEKSERKAAPVVVRAWFKDKYREEVDHYLEDTPNTRYWQSSGRYGGEEDIPRRFRVGLEHVDRYLAWYEKHPEEVIWITPDGTPAIELPFKLDLGGVQVRGMLDQAIVVRPGRAFGGEARPESGCNVIARDIKTGNSPGKVEQLSLAGMAVTTADPTASAEYGDFLMTKTGYPTYPYDLINVDVLTEKFVTMNDAVLAGDFPAKPEDSKCARCDVADNCKFRA